MRRVFFSVFIGCSEFGIWFKQNQIFQKQHVKRRKWRWTSYGIKIISWRLGGRHTQPLATMPFISARVNLQQQSGCTIVLEGLGIRQRQKRLFNLGASDNLYETGVFFRFIGCTEFGIWFKQNQIFQKQHVKLRKWRWTSYGIKIISWRLGGRHTQPLATMPFISARVNLQQQSGCTIDLEGLGIRQRQKRLFNLGASDNLYETGVFFRFHRLH